MARDTTARQHDDTTATRARPRTRRSPEPHTEAWRWQSAARCRGLDSSMFFGRDGEGRRKRRERETRAKALCDQCVVMHCCRQHAMDVGETFGIWGGLSAAERLKLLAGKPMRD